MKKFITPLTLLAFTLTSCVSERDGEKAAIQLSLTRPITFHICEMQTKTAFGQGQDGVYPTLWTSNDSAVKLALNYTEAKEAAVTPSEDFRTATFSANIDATESQAPYTFYAVSPATAAKALSPSRKAWNITIPAVQTPLEGSVDESAQILAAASQPSDALPQDVDVHFNHLTAYGRMSFVNLELGDAVVSKVELTATTPFVGDWYWDCTEEHSLTDNGASSTLTLNTSRTSDLWFACAPVDMSEQIVIFSIYTDKGVLEKEVEFPEGRKFNAGRIAVFSIDMTGIELSPVNTDDFVLVTDTADLHDGDEILILNAEEVYAIGTNQKNNNREAAAISVKDHTVSTVPDDVQVITLMSGNTSGTWHMIPGSGYLANANGKNNKLVTVQSITNNATWTISVASSGIATVKAGSGDRNLLRYNSNQSNGSPLFACYASGQKDIVIYRKGAVAVNPAAEDPITEESEYGAYLGTDTRSYVAGQDQYMRSYSSAGVQTFTILNPADKEQLEISGYKKDYVKGDPVVVTVNHKKGRTVISAGITYSMKVVKEEGPKVWLGNGSGNGFIIKK